MGSYTNTFTSAGTSTITLPYMTSINAIKCWAGGGRGGKRTTAGQGGGAGGGAFADRSATPAGENQTTWNAVLTIVVGAGGDDTVKNGGTSSVTLTLAGAKSGTVLAAAGGGTGVNDNTTTGAAGGAVITGTGKAGGTGAAASGGRGGGGGGGAGSTSVGGNASGVTAGTGGSTGGGAGGNGAAVAGAGTNGNPYGGAGGGAVSNGTTQSGGRGEAGAVYIDISWPDNVVMMSNWEGHVGTTINPNEKVLNAGAAGMTDWENPTGGVAQYWTAVNEDSEKYGIGTNSGFTGSYQSVQLINTKGAIRSNDFGITNAMSHTYTLTFKQESSQNFNVYQWNGSTTVIIGENFNANATTTPSSESIVNFTPSDNNFNGLFFEIPSGTTGDYLFIDEVSCVQTS